MTLWRILLKGKRRALNHKNETSNNIRIFKRPQPGRKSPTAALLLISFYHAFQKQRSNQLYFQLAGITPPAAVYPAAFCQLSWR